jgi:hypothetical protein
MPVTFREKPHSMMPNGWLYKVVSFGEGSCRAFVINITEHSLSTTMLPFLLMFPQYFLHM